MNVREQVLQGLLALPLEDRAFVAAELEQSLDHEQFASPEIAAAWTAEIDRRIAAYERGELQASDADASIARIRDILTDHRCARDDQKTLARSEDGQDCPSYGTAAMCGADKNVACMLAVAHSDFSIRRIRPRRNFLSPQRLAFEGDRVDSPQVREKFSSQMLRHHPI